MTRIKVPQVLANARGVNAYSDEGAALKDAMHSKGKAMLKELARELAGDIGGYSVRSNLGGIAVSGEVTLHGDHLYVQLYESATSRGLSLLYRSCASQRDYTGDQNHFVALSEFAQPEKQDQVLSTMRRLIARKREAQPA